MGPESATAREAAQPRVFRGRPMVGVAIFVFATVVGPAFQGLGTFFVAFERHFGWSRTALSGAFSLSRVEGALLGPIEGLLTDRLGARRVILIGLAILGLGMISLGLIRNLPTFYAAFLVVFTGAGLAGFIPLMGVINNWFVRRRATATALALTGINLGGLLVPALAWAITSLGWQATAIGLGIAVWTLSVPVMLILRNRPEDVGLYPDGAPTPEQELEKTDIPVEAIDQDFTARQALRTWAFWNISISHGIGATAFVTISLHILPALTDTGLSLQLASTVVAAYTGTAIASQLLGGYLGDRLPKTPLIALYMVIQGLGILVAANGPGLAGSYGFAVLFGIGFGGRVPLLVAIRGEYFGRRAFATILGISQLPMNVLMVAAPIGAGYLYDQQGSYFTPFLILTLACFAGAVLILLTRKPRHPGLYGTA